MSFFTRFSFFLERSYFVHSPCVITSLKFSRSILSPLSQRSYFVLTLGLIYFFEVFLAPAMTQDFVFSSAGPFVPFVVSDRQRQTKERIQDACSGVPVKENFSCKRVIWHNILSDVITSFSNRCKELLASSFFDFEAVLALGPS